MILSAAGSLAGTPDTLFVEERQIPILVDRQDNILHQMRIDNSVPGRRLGQLNLKLAGDLKEIKSVKLYYGGTEALQNGKRRFAPVSYLSAYEVGKTRAANPSYSLLLATVKQPGELVTFTCDKALYPGINYFWISIEMKKNASLLSKLTADVTEASVDDTPVRIVNQGNIAERLLGRGVRQAGDDGVSAYRIPGMATSNRGTLLAVYDIRHNNSADLQEHVTIGLSRSTDKGQTWDKMRTIMDFGNDEGLPLAQNGVGDPAILVDEKTGTIWVIAAWTHGMGNSRAWFSSHDGLEKERTAQLVLVKSTDDGRSWSAPINITSQVKRPEWRFLLQGPGRGITMTDGTLVFPIQFIDANSLPHAGIMYSKDRGENWQIHEPARSNTTESQVAEVEPGRLMLNMRDNRGGSRAVATTDDFGKTWNEHSSSRGALPEPVCMASLIHIPAKDNPFGKELLLFSNPNTTNGRHSMTIKASIDGGKSWPHEFQLLIDQDGSWGYSCLSRVDNETIGIFYESSTAHMLYQRICLTDIIKE